jgi:hypothetical protein
MKKELTPAESELAKERFLITSLPLLNDGYGTVECMIPHRLQVKLLSTPGFPKAPMRVPKRVDLRDMYTGELPGFDQSNPVFPPLGMFATEDIEAGTCIEDERPMIISSRGFPVLTQRNMNPQQEQQLLEGAKNALNGTLKTVWERLDMERQMIFLSLANAHTDGDDATSFFLGRFITNTLGCDIDDTGNQYGGVCNVLSRVNHRYAFISLFITSSIY